MVIKFLFMKKILYCLTLVFSALLFSSCLKGGLEDLPEYEDAEITSVSAVRYRYMTDEKSPASGEYLVKEVDLTSDADIDSESGSVKIKVSVPSEFPAGELGNLSTSNLVVAVSISTAARMSPVGDSSQLGVPADWSKLNRYVVQAANGNKKDWTIEIVEFNK